MNLSKDTKNTLKIVVIAGLVFFTLFSAFKCNKLDDLNQTDLSIKDTNTIVVTAPSQVMDPGQDPNFINYDLLNDPTLQLQPADDKYGFLATQQATWARYMYVDHTDTIYSNTAARNRFASYCKKYKFTGAYFYDTGNILSSTGNWNNFGTFLKQLHDSGVVYKAVNKESANDFKVGGKVTNYNNAQTDYKKKINRANLEWEWWNGVTSWSNWISVLQQISAGTVADNDFYEGWYKNLGGTIDTIAAKYQVMYSDRILEHVYVPGVPTYGYANAQSQGTTGGRLDIIAKGARQNGRKADLFIIISAEKKTFGAANDFSGGVLLAANTQSNPFLYIENQAYNNIYGGMTAFQKQWINFKGFIWFDKRWIYQAVAPK